MKAPVSIRNVILAECRHPDDGDVPLARARAAADGPAHARCMGAHVHFSDRPGRGDEPGRPYAVSVCACPCHLMVANKACRDEPCPEQPKVVPILFEADPPTIEDIDFARRTRNQGVSREEWLAGLVSWALTNFLGKNAPSFKKQMRHEAKIVKKVKRAQAKATKDERHIIVKLKKADTSGSMARKIRKILGGSARAVTLVFPEDEDRSLAAILDVTLPDAAAAMAALKALEGHRDVEYAHEPAKRRLAGK